MTVEQTRPGSVTLIATLCAIFGILEIVTGALAFAFLPALTESSETSDTQLGWSAIVLIVLGIAYFLVSLGLYRGRDVARVIVLLVSLVHGINGIWLALSGQLLAGLLTIAIALFVIVLLWTGEGAKYFARRTLVG